ncbi:VOC family protein [Aeromicrobium sp. CTD01-1L150]|uniref:VOC family protein n=1 Tax=Aeromicrobium sp. CTD01-1L150 TaxID=3341830 RepID=UPI0035C1149F
MVSFISHLSIDAHDAYAQSRWWQQVLDYVEDPADPNEPGHEECAISKPDGTGVILFIEVPEAKELKNRLHLDLRPSDRFQEAEVQRLLALGAATVADHRGIYGPGSGWVTLADPEGNEFCVLLSRQERARWNAERAGDG